MGVRRPCAERGVPSGDVSEECVCCRASVWCLLAPSRGGVPLLGETRSAELTLEDPCLLYSPFQYAHPPRGQGSLARNPMPIIRPAGCASELPGPGCEVNDCTPSAPSAQRSWEEDRRKRRGVERLCIPPGAPLRRGGVDLN